MYYYIAINNNKLGTGIKNLVCTIFGITHCTCNQVHACNDLNGCGKDRRSMRMRYAAVLPLSTLASSRSSLKRLYMCWN